MQFPIPEPGAQFGPWVVVDEPVRIGVKCSRCGAVRRVKLDELHGWPGRCRKCHAGSRVTNRGGGSSHPIYRLWTSMKHRCGATVTGRVRRNYYDRGIRVCPEWADYGVFYAWAVSAGWAPGLQLDREDSNGNYEPGNCRFVPRLDNIDNRRVTKSLTAWGETKLLVSWTDDPRCVVDYHCLWDRLYRSVGKWTPERALSTPRRVLKSNRVLHASYRPQKRIT